VADKPEPRPDFRTGGDAAGAVGDGQNRGAVTINEAIELIDFYAAWHQAVASFGARWETADSMPADADSDKGRILAPLAQALSGARRHLHDLAYPHSAPDADNAAVSPARSARLRARC
jgi:hypothetical protein